MEAPTTRKGTYLTHEELCKGGSEESNNGGHETRKKVGEIPEQFIVEKARIPGRWV
jgi:hypothetical protein